MCSLLNGMYDLLELRLFLVATYVSFELPETLSYY